MTLNESFGIVIYGILGASFVVWYLSCLVTMLFSCQSPRSYFSYAYPSSEWFLLVNIIAVVCGAAFVLHWSTQ